METWQWIKALSAVGQSDWHRQNKDRTKCLISRARAADQQLRRLQECNEQRPNDQLGRLCGNSEEIVEAFPEGLSP
jgi:hypothetical protein